MLTLKFKKLSENVKLPTQAHKTDACYDIYSPVSVTLPAKQITKIKLDFAVACPEGYKLCIYSRSGLGSKGLLLTNCVGIVDPDYRGCVSAAFYNLSNEDYVISEGDRILQMSLEKINSFDIEVVEDLNETERGSGGFGSSGK